MVYPIAMIVAITLVVVVASCVGVWGSTAAAAALAHRALGNRSVPAVDLGSPNFPRGESEDRQDRDPLHRGQSPLFRKFPLACSMSAVSGATTRSVN